MRTLTLNPIEANILFTCLNHGDPQRGLAMQDIRSAIPILDKVEEHVTRIPTDQGERLEFSDMTIKLKESEHTFVVGKLESSGGWMSVTQGRQVIALQEKIKELPSVEDPADKEDSKKGGKTGGGKK